MTLFSIPVIEHQSARPGRAITPALPPFLVNNRQLLIAMVRSILTSNPGKESRKFTAAIAEPTLRFLLDWRAAPNLRISTTFFKAIRDFSATTRIGELAQAVSYAYWNWERGYSWIADFGPWASKLHPPLTATQTPDFVMWNPATNGLAVMESKGTGGKVHVQAMGKALRQCGAAVSHPAFSRGYGCVLTLDVGSPTGVGILHVRDPEREGQLTDVLRHHVFRRSYASWFDLVGDVELANVCREHIDDGMWRSIDMQRILQIQQEPDNQLRAITAAALGLDPNRTHFGIDPVFAQAIADFEFFKRVDWHAMRAVTSPSFPESSRGLMRFPDGTLISEDNRNADF